jgi:uncharacterized protein YlzI (FlbEa/FlbD family)
MIRVTRLDGAHLYINEQNIQWIEVLPDTAITFVAGARLLVREKPDDILAAMTCSQGDGQSSRTDGRVDGDELPISRDGISQS